MARRERLSKEELAYRREREAQPVDDETVAALRAFAKRHGRSWKFELGVKWMNASADPVLHRLRNTHGPTWLAGYKLPGDDDGKA